MKAERWPSGRRRSIGNAVRGQLLRGFESLSLRHFFCQKNGERRRKSSLHCAKHNFTQKAQPFLHIFTKTPFWLACEVVSFRWRSITLACHGVICKADEDGWSCRLRREDVFLFTAHLTVLKIKPPEILRCRRSRDLCRRKKITWSTLQCYVLLPPMEQAVFPPQIGVSLVW